MSSQVKELVHRADTTKTRFLGSLFYSYRIQLFHSGITYIMVSDFQFFLDIHNSNIFTIFLCGAASGQPVGNQCRQWCGQPVPPVRPVDAASLLAAPTGGTGCPHWRHWLPTGCPLAAPHKKIVKILELWMSKFFWKSLTII